jgi:hypothetical protein
MPTTSWEASPCWDLCHPLRRAANALATSADRRNSGDSQPDGPGRRRDRRPPRAPTRPQRTAAVAHHPDGVRCRAASSHAMPPAQGGQSVVVRVERERFLVSRRTTPPAPPPAALERTSGGRGSRVLHLTGNAVTRRRPVSSGLMAANGPDAPEMTKPRRSLGTWAAGVSASHLHQYP